MRVLAAMPLTDFDDATLARLFTIRDAFDAPTVQVVLIASAAMLVTAYVTTRSLAASGRLSPERRRELVSRQRSWLAIALVMAIPVLLGAAWTILGITLLSLACYREFARATGLFREKLMSALVVLGIVAVGAVAFDNWFALFQALPALVICLLLAAPLLQDRPERYIQRVGLAIMAFMMFGYGLGHLAYLANEDRYRSIILMLLFCVQLSEIVGFVCDRSIAGQPLLPRSSSARSRLGATAALVVTAAAAAWLAHLTFRDSQLDTLPHLIALGALIAVGAQVGDLVVASIKRDLGLTELAATFPGHGGFLDRLNGALTVAPAAFLYIRHVDGIGAGTPHRLLSHMLPL